jgi:hypothetical protein
MRYQPCTLYSVHVRIKFNALYIPKLGSKRKTKKRLTYFPGVTISRIQRRTGQLSGSAPPRSTLEFEKKKIPSYRRGIIALNKGCYEKHIGKNAKVCR